MEKIALDFEKGNGLIPTVIQDSESNEVLMVAYMSEERLKLTLESKKTWFYSRSRNERCTTGVTAGHFQEFKENWTDCYNHTLLIKVMQNGAACHTVKKSCFFRRLC